MESQSTMNVPALLRRYGVKPDRRLGQNFLVDESALKKVVAAAEIAPHEEILEIGAGLGSLTRHLAQCARRVTAVELDDRLWRPLQEATSAYPNVRLVQGDILQLELAQLLAGQEYLVVANIPYYITSTLIRRLLEAPQKPNRLILTVQEEVAERICAREGEMSLLALSVQVYGEPRLIARIPAGSFYPPPKVNSAVVRIDLHRTPCFPARQLSLFFQLAKAGFAQKRKTLRNSLAAGMGWTPARAQRILAQAGIAPQRRAESLNLPEWRRLVEAVELDEREEQPG